MLSNYIIETGLILLLIFSPLAFGSVEIWSISFIHFITLFLAVIWLASMIIKLAKKEKLKFITGSFGLPILSFCLWALFLAVRSKIPQASEVELLKLANYVLLYYLVVNSLTKKAQVYRLISIVILIGIGISAYGLIQRMNGLDTVYGILRPIQYHGRVGGTYICPNHFAGYLELAIPLCLAPILFSNLSIGLKMLLGYGGCVMLAALILSLSRGGWLGFLGSLGVIAFASFRVKEFKRVGILFLVLIILGLGIITLNKEAVFKRVENIRADPAITSRILFWKGTLNLIEENPVFGTGPGTFRWRFRRWRYPQTVLDLNYAHNDYLHFAADFGLLGLGLILWFFFYLFREGLYLMQRLDALPRAIVVGVLAGSTALFIHSFFSFNFHIMANAATFVILISLLRTFRRNISEASSRPAFSIVAVLILFFILLFFSIISVRHFFADRWYKKGWREEQEICWNEALNSYRKASLLDKNNFLYYERIANIYLNKARFSRQGKEELLNEAIIYYRQGIRFNPYEGNLYIGLAGAYNELGKKEEALQAYKDALSSDPNNAHYHEMLGLFYLNSSMPGEAVVQFKKALQISSKSTLSKKYLKYLTTNP